MFVCVWYCCSLSVRTTCGEDFHTCDNELCVPLVWKCDHDNDCGDSSDEGAAAECSE